MRVFFDAGLLFNAAHNAQSKSRHLLEAHTSLGFTPLTCDYAVEEARRNLALKAPRALSDPEGLLKRLSLVPTVQGGSVPAPIREKDHPILLSALAARADYLATGDHRDFGIWLDRPKGPAGKLLVISSARLFDLLVPEKPKP